MGGHRPHLVRSTLLEQFGGGDDGSGRVDHVVGEDARATFDVAHHFGGLGHVGGALGSALVDECQVGAAVTEVLGHPLGDLDPAGVGRHDHRLGGVRPDVSLQDGHCGEVVDRAVEESLDLTGMQVDRDHPLRAGLLEHVSDQPGGDRLAAGGLAVLAGIAVERAHGGDPFRRGARCRIDHDQVFHDRIVDGATVDTEVGLHHEDVGAAHGLAETAPNLTVRELDEVRVAEFDVQVRGHLLSERRMGAPGVEREPLGGDLFHDASILSRPCRPVSTNVSRRAQCRTRP